MGPDVTRGGVTPTGTSFSASFAFLPERRRRALAAVYAFCRASDDIADGDGPADLKAARLAAWSDDLDRALAGGAADPVLTGLAAVAAEYGIPHPLFRDLVRGVGMDLAKSRYRSYAELEAYCLLVASAVGLMCLDVFGRRNPRTEAYARDLGVAMQITNIIRDVGTDARIGRIYLPLEDLERFGCPVDDILTLRDSGRLRTLLSFEADRAEGLYARASSALEPSDARAMTPARVMQAIYHRLLRKMRGSSFDVLGRTFAVSRAERAVIAVRHGLLGALLP